MNALEEIIQKDTLLKGLKEKYNEAGGTKFIIDNISELLQKSLETMCGNKYLYIRLTKYNRFERDIDISIQKEYDNYFQYSDQINMPIVIKAYENDFIITIKITYQESRYSSYEKVIEKKFDIRDIIFESTRLYIFKKQNIKIENIKKEIIEVNKDEINNHIKRLKIQWDWMLDNRLKDRRLLNE